MAALPPMSPVPNARANILKDHATSNSEPKAKPYNPASSIESNCDESAPHPAPELSGVQVIVNAPPLGSIGL